MSLNPMYPCKQITVLYTSQSCLEVLVSFGKEYTTLGTGSLGCCGKTGVFFQVVSNMANWHSFLQLTSLKKNYNREIAFPRETNLCSFMESRDNKLHAEITQIGN